MMTALVNGKRMNLNILKAKKYGERSGHKYIKKIGSGKGAKYFYNQEELNQYLKEQEEKAEQKKTEVRMPESSKWSEALKPTEEEFEKMKEGDLNGAADYMIRVWFKKTGMREGGIDVSDIAKVIPKSKMESYEQDDLNQELFLRLVKIIENKKLDTLPINEFSKYIARTYKNLAIDKMREKVLSNKNEKEITDWSDDIESHYRSIEEELTMKEMIIEVNKIAKDIYNDLNKMDKAIWANRLNGLKAKEIIKKHPDLFRKSLDKYSEKTVINYINGVVKKKINNRIDKYFHGKGYYKDVKNPSSWLKEAFQKYVNRVEMVGTKGIESTLKHARKARIVRVDDKLYLCKAKRAEVGELRTHGGKQYKKTGEGQWVLVKKEGEKPAKKTNGEDTPEGKIKKQFKQKIKDTLKNALKGMLKVFTEAQAGGSPVGAAAGEAERAGAGLKSTKVEREASKELKKKEKASA